MITRLQSAVKKLLTANGFRYDPHPFGNQASVTLWRRKLGRGRAQEPRKRLVIIPGFGDTPLSFLPMTQLLLLQKAVQKQAYDELVLLEFSGYLGSLHPDQRAIDSVSRLNDAVETLLGQLAPHTLIGHSLGGFLAAYYASEKNRPHLEKLILLSPAGLTISEEAQAKWEAVLKEIGAGRVELFIHAAMGKPPKNPLLRKPYDLITANFSEFLLREESLALLLSFEERHAMQNRASKILTPTLLVWGKKDALIPYASFPLWSAELEKSLGKQKLTTLSLAGVGHGIPLEAPLKTAQAIARHLSS